MASGVIFSAAMVRSPSFSRSSSSTTTIIRPARISSIAVGTSVNAVLGVIKLDFLSKIVAKWRRSCGHCSMPPFGDKQEFTDGDPEDTLRREPLSEESAGENVGDLETDDEFAELSPEEMQEFTAAEWRGEFPDYDATELEEKIAERPRRWIAPVASGVMGTSLGAAFAGLLVDRVPRQQQVRTF